MTTNSLLLAFPNFVKRERIDIDCLRELDRALESVSSEPSQNTEETLNKWLRNHKNIREQLREFAPNNKEITKVKAPQTKTGVANVFQELSEAVKQKLKEIENNK
jgi:iron-sulfur cluster repair protein YtfE (RIC family)